MQQLLLYWRCNECKNTRKGKVDDSVYKGAPVSGWSPSLSRFKRAGYAPSAVPLHGPTSPMPNLETADLPHTWHQTTWACRRSLCVAWALRGASCPSQASGTSNVAGGSLYTGAAGRESPTPYIPKARCPKGSSSEGSSPATDGGNSSKRSGLSMSIVAT